ncbi:MAG: helix-turn-helix transcriptional regulator [Glaciecola sp.]
MKTSVYSPHYEKLRVWLKSARQARNLSLRDVSEMTGVHHSVYGKMEQARRRIDIIEFVEYCKALEVDPLEGVNVIINSMDNP